MAVVATLSKGYDLDCVWRQASLGPLKSAGAPAPVHSGSRTGRSFTNCSRQSPTRPFRAHRTNFCLRIPGIHCPRHVPPHRHPGLGAFLLASGRPKLPTKTAGG